MTMTPAGLPSLVRRSGRPADDKQANLGAGQKQKGVALSRPRSAGEHDRSVARQGNPGSSFTYYYAFFIYFTTIRCTCAREIIIFG